MPPELCVLEKTLLAELGGFCDDDAPVWLVSFVLPEIREKRAKNTGVSGPDSLRNFPCNPP
jgi:hypothetical protein